MENVFSKSYLQEKDASLARSSPNTVLHISSLLAWTLLLTICPISEVEKKLEMCVFFEFIFTRAFAARAHTITTDRFPGISINCPACCPPRT